MTSLGPMGIEKDCSHELLIEKATLREEDSCSSLNWSGAWWMTLMQSGRNNRRKGSSAVAMERFFKRYAKTVPSSKNIVAGKDLVSQEMS